MRRFVKSLASVILIPLTRWYLRKERQYSYNGTKISVMPGVFHPGLFSSTKFILQFLETQKLAGQTLLELGSGTGLISVMAAKAHAKVTAVDYSYAAVENTRINAEINKTTISLFHSDLFTSLKDTNYDWIIINPPYYAHELKKESDLAWYCGKHFEYFQKLFEGLQRFLHARSTVLMVLTRGCDLPRIFSIGNAAGFRFDLIHERKDFFDGKDFLFSLRFTAFDMAEV